MLKRLLSLALASLVLLSLPSCGKDGETADETTSAPETTSGKPLEPETAPEAEEEKSAGCGAFAAAPLAAIIPTAAAVSKKRKNKNK